MSDGSAFRHVERLRVRWSEVDARRIVFNAHDQMDLDSALAGYRRALALPCHETMALLQGEFDLRKSSLEHEAVARHDEELQVHGKRVCVFADPAIRARKPVPSDLREGLMAPRASATSARCCCTRRPVPRPSASAWASSRAGRVSRKPASCTWR